MTLTTEEVQALAMVIGGKYPWDRADFEEHMRSAKATPEQTRIAWGVLQRCRKAVEKAP